MISIDDKDNVFDEFREVLTGSSPDLRSSLYRDIVLNAMKCKKDELDILDLKMINRTLAEFRHAANTFKSYRKTRKLSIFGSSKVSAGSPSYQQALELGKLAVRDGFMVITGGGKGIMQAGIEGAGSDQSFGIKIMLPSHGESKGTYYEDPKVINFKYFFTRKIFFVMEADAIALFPGGFGTHDEGFEVLTLMQTGKAPPMPVVLMETPGEDYWEAWDFFLKKHMLNRGLISRQDLSFYRIVHSPGEAQRWIKHYYSTFHSLRQVHNYLVIRLEKEVQDYQVAMLNQMFPDIIQSGSIQKSLPLPEEADEPDLLGKPRLNFQYNHQSAGRLNELILSINNLGRRFD
jgi:uncharacterized protein (TIGR00730 family)